MQYKGYAASVGYDDIHEVFYGHVTNSGAFAICNFDAADVEGLKREFKISVDEYLLCSKEYGDIPQKPYTGKVDVQLGPSLHKTVTIVAVENDMSVHEWLEQAIKVKLYAKWAAEQATTPPMSEAAS